MDGGSVKMQGDIFHRQSHTNGSADTLPFQHVITPFMASFIKHNHSSFPDALLKEAAGLELLRKALQQHKITELHIPEIIQVNDVQLELTQIHSHPASEALMQTLGEGLARLHTIPQSHYGLAEDNYIGLAPQRNILTDNWGKFFADYRLGFQVERIADKALRETFAKVLKQYRGDLINFLNQATKHPSLVHGDLWSGNVLFGDSKVWLIDPAVYYGDREADIAMTEMFGGFGHVFYKAYDETLPLSAVYPGKKHIYNLYHYLNHYNLFGDAYRPACEQGFNVIQEIVK